MAKIAAISLCLVLPFAEGGERVVDHFDPIEADPDLTLQQVVDLTLDQFPRGALVDAKSEEARALRRRGNSLLSGAPYVSFRYQDDRVADDAGLREIESELYLPLWNWGQRSANQALAELAESDAAGFAEALRLEVAGRVREALWNLALQESRRSVAKQISDLSQRLEDTVERKVELGELARADLLLARSDALERKSELAQAEAEVMHARKAYATLTRIIRIPADYSEYKSPQDAIMPSHPALASAQALVARLEADMKVVAATGSGQPNLTFAGKSERGGRAQQDIESVGVRLAIPFGGGAHLAPAIAAKNLELTQAMADRNDLYRRLEQTLHEAQHNLEVDRAELSLANERLALAEQYREMGRIAFENGEIRLIDLLKVQANGYAALRDAKQKAIVLQRDIARYNQAVGELP